MGFFDNLKNAANALGDQMVEFNDNAVAEWVSRYRSYSEWELKQIANSDTDFEGGSYKSQQIQAARYILVTQYDHERYFDGYKQKDMFPCQKYSIR